MKPKTYNLKLTLALLVAMLMAAANVQAAEYDLEVCGVQVTDDNKDDLKKINGVTGSGSASYNPDNHTLYLNNITISSDGVETIRHSIHGLIIEVSGYNKIVTNGEKTSIFNYEHTSITGSGTLDIDNASFGGAGIYVFNGYTLTIENCTVNVKSNGRGIDGAHQTLNINNATVTAYGYYGGSIASMIGGTINFNNTYISSPAGAYVDNDGNVCDSTGNLIKGKEVKIEPLYLWIGGKQVSPTNDDLNNLNTFPGVTAGTISYNTTTRTLSLKDAAISTSGSKCCILSRIDGMKIEVSGTNTLTGNGWSPIAFEDENSGTIQGDGTLDVVNNASDGVGIFARKGSLSIQECTLNITAGKYGIQGGGSNPLNIGVATISATGTNGGSIYGFSELNFDGSSIHKPANAAFNPSKKAVCYTDGTIVKEKVEIGLANYDLIICGTQVTGLNKNDLSGIVGVEGTVNYNPETKTLRLENANMFTTGNTCCILSRIDGLIIDVIGNNFLSSKGWSPIAFEDESSGTIQGDGRLELVNNSSDGVGIFTRKGSIAIRNLNLHISAEQTAIMGANVTTEKSLTFENATVTALTLGNTIVGFNALTLTRCYISKPTDAVFNAGKKAVCYPNGTIVTGEINIVPAYDLWICGVRVTSLNKDDLSVIEGVTGTLKYNPDTKTLEFRGATINVTGEINGINSKIEGLIIDIDWTNTINANGYAGLQLSGKSCTIVGSSLNTSKLYVTNLANDYAINVSNTSLTINYCILEATSAGQAISGSGANGGTLTIWYAKVTATGSANGSITNFNDINLHNTAIIEPVGGRVSKGADTFYAVRDVLGNVIKETVKTSPAIPYNIYICDIPVTPINAGDLSSIPGVVAGMISYNPDNNTLTLDNATINVIGNGNGILSKNEGLNIELIGNNTITNNGYSSLQFDGNSGTILGDGTLTVTNQADDYAIFASAGASLTIKNCTVNATGGKRGISGSSTSTLTIDNANISAIGTGDGSIYGFNEANLTNCFILQPAYGTLAYNTTKKAVCKADGTIIKDEVKILQGTAYDLRICGVQVTSVNKDNLADIPDVTAGTVSYNPNNNTLTLNGATINVTGNGSGILSKIEGLNIELIGNNTITNNGYSSLQFDGKSGTILGDGTLTVTNQADDYAIFASGGASLTIKNCTVNATGGKRGISGSSTSTLTIDNATVSAIGTSEGSIYGFNTLTLTNCFILQPTGVTLAYNTTQKAVCNADGTIIKDEVKILRGTAYDLRICGVQVTSVNKANLAAIPGVSAGTISYNADNNTLTLNGATVNVSGNTSGIVSKVEGLKIELIGNNTINANGWSGIDFIGKSGTILGDGTLTVTNQADDYAIFASGGASLTIKNCTVSATGGKRGISGNGSSTLTFDNAIVSAIGTSEGSIYGFSVINFNNCEIVEPADAAFDATKKAICSADTVVKTLVKIEPTYDLWINGTQVKFINKANLAGIPGVSAGTVSYNSDTNTLTLNDATINATGTNSGILSKIEGLTIELAGNNTITNNGNSSLQFDGKSGTILGDGTLTVTNQADDYAIFASAGASLTIKNCTVSATGGKRGISGSNTGTLTIDNATVSAIGTSEGSIYGFKEANLTDCFILQPAYVTLAYNTTKKAVCKADGTIIKDEVKILQGTAYDLRICGVQVTSVNKDNLADVPDVTAGTVSYNPNNNTLTLDNATINVTGNGSGILSKIEGLNIELIGNNTITNNGYSSVQFDGKSGTILGDGTLTVTNQANDYAIFASAGASLTIKNCTVSAKGGKRGISGSSTSTLNINNATVSAIGTSEGSIYGFNTLTLTGCFILQPTGVTLAYNTTQKAICNADGTIIKDEVKILRGTAYDLRICGVQVTSVNKDNLVDIPGLTAGTVSYNSNTNTLTLNNTEIATTGNTCCILSRIDNMIIEVIGVNNLTGNGFSPIAFENDNSGTIQGSGTLNLSNAHTQDRAIFMRNGSLTIKDCTLNASGGINAIFGNSGEATLTIDNAIVNASLNNNGVKDGTIMGFKYIQLKNCLIVQPADASFNATQKAICHTDGTIVKEKIEIVRGADLWICGKKVTPADMDDLASVSYDKGTVTGSISYDPITRTLTLENAAITTTVSFTKGIVSLVDGLKINLIGTNIISAHDNGIEFAASATIVGSGTLTVNASDGICLWDNTYLSLAIKECTVNITGIYKGIYAMVSRANLIVDNATVSIRGNAKASMSNMDLTLTNTLIANPHEVQYDDVDGAFKDNDGNIFKGEVRIIPGTTYALKICDVPVTSVSKDNLAAISYQNGTVSGNISYDPDTETLTLDGAAINSNKFGNKGVIRTDIDDLKIVLIGNNTITTNQGTGIMCNDTVTIQGDGTLSINGPVGMYFKNLLTIKNSTVTISGSLAGIHSSDNSDTDVLTIDNATVSVTGTEFGSFYNVNNVNLIDCEIVSPANAAFDATKKAICDTLGNIIKAEINIWPSNLPTFTSTTPENWKTASKWSTGAVPDASQRVYINGDAVISEDLNVAAFAIKQGKSITVNAGKKLTAGKSFNNGTIYLLSDATNGTATLVGDVAGQADIQQAAINYRTYYLSSPVSGTVSTSDNMGNYITFTESTDQWSTAAPFAGITPVAGKGYGVQVSAGVAVSERGKATTLSFTGTLNNGEVKIPITSGNRKFNFLGNPYPSYLNTIKVVANPNITKSLWFYSKLADNTPYQFTAYNIPTGLSIPDEGHDYGYIPPMQGFWVKANADVDYTFNNEMRVHKPAGSPAIFRTPQAAERQLMRLQLSNGIIKDEAAVLFSEEATNDWNTPKMTSQKLCIYTLKDGENLALNSNKAINYDVEIPVGVKAESGVYTFSASKLENFGAERVFLLDKVANTTTNLSNNDIHTVNFAENYEGTDRFALVFPRSGVITGWDGVVQTEFYAYAKDKRIIVSTDAESGTIYVYNSVGQQVAAETISGKLTTVSAALPEGVYVVKLNNQTTKVVVK